MRVRLRLRLRNEEYRAVERSTDLVYLILNEKFTINSYPVLYITITGRKANRKAREGRTVCGLISVNACLLAQRTDCSGLKGDIDHRNRL